MGAMAQALRLMRESVRNDLEGGPMPRALRSACAEADAALTDAPPVFTLEEVREAVTKAATGATITHGQRVTPDQFARWVTERLSRDKPVTKPTPRTSHRCEEECCLPK